MITTFLVTKVLLALVGLAVLGYFLREPQMLPPGETLIESSDRLFSRYIVIGLPIGFSGLVAAGMMAAAMSSLSSGVNSSAAVISEDFIERLGLARNRNETAHVQRARWLSVVVGTVAVLGSLGVERISGNLYEVVAKMSNTLVAPLFVLFFMAMFVPWATTFGTLVGVAASVVAAVEISFIGYFGIGVFLNVPGSLIVGVAVGLLASLLPIGRRVKGVRNLFPGLKPPA
jgi:Na+/proline symporter